MERTIKIELKQDKIESLELYAKFLNKDINTMLDEALAQYFKAEEKRVSAQNIHDDGALTNLDYHEFWDGLD